ncbi:MULTISPECIES: acyl-CoA dehydrogenase family protein [unclassified Paenibacillus]|uniref:acyl-CoA dehydrogenase family protein n=1 Tax=unclassified Paenibacillus TaxID=185978 RepID=UPI0030F8ABD7
MGTFGVQEALRKEEFRRFTELEVFPLADKIDRDEQMPRELIRKLGESGYLGAFLPKRYGGHEMSMSDVGCLNEELGRGCSSTRGILTVQGMVEIAIDRWGTPEQRQEWLPELAQGLAIGAFALSEQGAGTDAKSIETAAVVQDGVYILNGHKKWITMGQLADVFIVFANYNEKVTAFLMPRDTPGLTVRPIGGMLGLKGSMLAELQLNNCRIPLENMIGSEGTGLTNVAMSCLDYGRYTVACGCVGLAQACLDESLLYARKRKQFGNSLRNHQLIQKMITEMVVGVQAARVLCTNAGRLKDEGDPESIMETWNAKYFASKVAVKSAADALQIQGAVGFSANSPAQRHYRDSKVYEIIEGTSQIHELMIATNAFRRM